MDIRKTTVMVSNDVYQVNLSKKEALELVNVIDKLAPSLINVDVDIDIGILSDMADDLRMNLDVPF